MSAFRGTLEFFHEIGVYDVILPFLLVFTIIFAILEKSKIFGQVKVEGKDYTRKNLNSMVAFVTAFFVVGSTQLVAIMSQTVAHVALFVVLIVMFLILAGSFHKDGEFFLEGKWQKRFMWIVFIGIILIFLNAWGMLGFLYGYTTLYWNSTTISSIILLLVVVGIMMFITGDPKGRKEES